MGIDAVVSPHADPVEAGAGRRVNWGAGLTDRPWVPALAAGLLALVFVGALLARAGGDPSLLVHAGAPCATVRAAPALASCDATKRTGIEPAVAGSAVGGSAAPGSLTVQPADEAFDGQFFYRLGVAPWSTADRLAGVQFDLPALRNARWGYGALAYVASAGDPDLVPWALIGLNVIAAAAVGAIGGALARSSGRHAAWGLLLALWPGFAYSLSLDTSELVASAFLLAGLLALRRRRWALGALALTAAVLTRDTTVVVPVGVTLAGVWAWWQSRSGRPEPVRELGAQTPVLAPERTTPVRAGIVALAVFAGWQILQRVRFGAWPLTSSGDNNLTAPLSGLVTELGRDVPPSSGEEAFRLLCIAGLIALVGTAGWCWRRSAAPLTERLAWVPAAAVVAVLNAYLWSGATAFARAATEVGLLSILIILGAPSDGPSRARRLGRVITQGLRLPLVALGLGGFWLLTAAVQVAKLG